MPHAKRLVIIAGEESGDAHAAAIIRDLKTRHPSCQISGIGGRHMQAASVELLSDLAKFGVTGATEVIRHLATIRKAFQLIKAHLTTHKPDLLVLVDYPGFNLRLAKFAKKTLGIPILYYISPQIWAWKAGRIHDIRKYVDHMAVILPFEKLLYEKAGVPVSFVGHPLMAKMAHARSNPVSRQTLGLPDDKRIVAFLPGSRTNEINQHMPVIRDTIAALSIRDPELHFAIPIAGTLDSAKIQAYFKHMAAPITFIQGQAIETMACSDCVVVASGTASLECALLEKPMCIIYKGALLSYIIAMKVIRVKYFGLCNLLENAMVAPELLQYDCNPTELTRMVVTLLDDHECSERMQRRLKHLTSSLSTQEADCSVVELIEQKLGLS